LIVVCVCERERERERERAYGEQCCKRGQTDKRTEKDSRQRNGIEGVTLFSIEKGENTQATESTQPNVERVPPAGKARRVETAANLIDACLHA